MFYLTRCECVKMVSKLCQIYGIGQHKARQLCAQIGISETHTSHNGTLKLERLKQFQAQSVSQPLPLPLPLPLTLTRFQLDQLNHFISLHYTVDSELRRTITQDIKRTRLCGSYRGFRHTAGLPVRGQRTHTNARTQSRLSRIAKVYTQ